MGVGVGVAVGVGVGVDVVDGCAVGVGVTLMAGCCIGADGKADGSVITFVSSGETVAMTGLPGVFIVSVLPIKIPMASTMTHKTTIAAIFQRVLLSIFPAIIHIPDLPAYKARPFQSLTIMRKVGLYFLDSAHAVEAHAPI